MDISDKKLINRKGTKKMGKEMKVKKEVMTKEDQLQKAIEMAKALQIYLARILTKLTKN